jgi:hypothetical protein
MARENLWMVRTNRRIEKALKLCDRQDQGLDAEQERLVGQRERAKEQRNILEGAKKHIISCGAIEEKVTQRWGKL